jgi:hypothetical protein
MAAPEAVPELAAATGPSDMAAAAGGGLGGALQQRFPWLRPLRRARGGDGSSSAAAAAATRGGDPDPSLADAGPALEQPGAAAGVPCIVFDVFSPPAKAAFSRRSPGPPAFRVAMAAAPTAGLPSLEQTLALLAESGPVPLRFAVVEGGEAAYLTLQSGSLLNLIAH